MIMKRVAAVARRNNARTIGWKLLAAAAFAAAAVTSAANAQGNLKIGVINVSRLLEQAPQSKAVTEKLQKEFEPRQQSILAARQKLQSQQETFQKDQAVMGEEERLNLERQIRDGQRDLQRTENEYLEDLNARRNEELGKLQREVLQRVQAMGTNLLVVSAALALRPKREARAGKRAVLLPGFIIGFLLVGLASSLGLVPSGLKAPAETASHLAMALATAGIRSMRGLTRWTERDLAALHGMGPRGIRILREALAEEGLGFREPGAPSR